MKYPTRQEIFDKVATHLLSQKKKATRRLGGRRVCAYLTPDGLRCAIGILIPDGHKALTCNYAARILTANFPDLQQHIGDDHLFLGGLQYLHDKFHPNQWKKKLLALAEEYNLDTAVLKKGRG